MSSVRPGMPMNDTVFRSGSLRLASLVAMAHGATTRLRAEATAALTGVIHQLRSIEVLVVGVTIPLTNFVFIKVLANDSGTAADPSPKASRMRKTGFLKHPLERTLRARNPV